jgi:CMP-N-acetylneuraminic acid synthetase
VADDGFLRDAARGLRGGYFLQEHGRGWVAACFRCGFELLDCEAYAAMNAKPDNTLAFIPCRSQSKRLPGKNLMSLAGRPLVFRAIDTALQMGFKTVVAPDHEDILHILDKEYGNTITLFLRDHDMADGNHQLESWAEAHAAMEPWQEGRADKNWGQESIQVPIPYGIMLEPSSPLRNPQDILACLAGLSHLHAIGTVTRCDRIKPTKLQFMDRGGMYRGNLDGRINEPGGFLEIVQFNGVCYAARRETILTQTLWDHMGTHVVEGVSFNIDTIEDFRVAEAYIKLKEGEITATQALEAQETLRKAGGPCYPI